MKKLFAMILAIVMIAAMAVPAMAADDYTLTINNETADHTYEAYQIFAGDLHDQGGGKLVLSNITWGTGVDSDKTVALLTAINAKFEKSFADAEAVAQWLAIEVTSDSTTLDNFADIVGDYLASTPNGTSTPVPADGETKAHYTISNLPAGYYLIKDQDNSLEGKNDAYTKYILRVLKDQTVTPKSDIPKVEKTINDTLNGTYLNYEDFDITDTAYYKWEGTLPANLGAYDTYYYKFTDTLPVGLNTNVTVGGKYYGIQQIYIEGHDGNVVHTFYDITDNDDNNNVQPDGVTVTYTNGDYTRDDDGNVTGTTTKETIEMEIEDLKALYPNLLSTHKIIVKYTAFVDRDAVIATNAQRVGMENKVVLEYSNEPNGDGKGQTLPDEAYAFTFSIAVDKHDADNTELKLEGAEFKLYYQRVEKDDNGDEKIVKYYAQVVTEEMIAEGKEINGVEVTQANLGNVYAFVADESKASILDTDVNGYLRVGGLDEGVYYLVETTAPAGYNLMETPVQVVIKPSYNDDGTLKEISYEVDNMAQASEIVSVRNDAGSTLPVTGGVGTTMFYIFGSIMVVGALVLLISKKRMAA